MRRAKFHIIVFSLLGAGLVVMILSMIVKEEGTKMLCLGITGLFYLAAAIQIVIYKRNG